MSLIAIQNLNHAQILQLTGDLAITAGATALFHYNVPLITLFEKKVFGASFILSKPLAQYIKDKCTADQHIQDSFVEKVFKCAYTHALQYLVAEIAVLAARVVVHGEL